MRAAIRSTKRISLAVASTVLVLLAGPIGLARADFGIAGFDQEITGSATGAPFTQAGGHPYEITTKVMLNTHIEHRFHNVAVPDGSVKDVVTELPAGLVGNPVGIPQCTGSQLNGGGVGHKDTGACPLGSVVGTIHVLTDIGQIMGESFVFPLYNMVPPPGEPAQFGFDIEGVPITLTGSVRNGGDLGVDVSSDDIVASLSIEGFEVTFWGVPADPSHNSQRCYFSGFGLSGTPEGAVCPGAPGTLTGPNVSTESPRAFLTLPPACGASGEVPVTRLRVDSWEDPGNYSEKVLYNHLSPGLPASEEAWGPRQGLTGCDRVPFAASLNAQPSAHEAATPTGMRFDLSMPQEGLINENGIAPADLKEAVVRLPAGIAVSPSSAQGLATCTEAQLGIGSEEPAACPEASKIGSAEVDTPLLPEPLTGGLYVAQQGQNPFGSLLAVYLVLEGHGVRLKLPGRVDLNRHTGQLTITYSNQPQLPFDDLKIDLKTGPRAPLVTPSQCGTYTTDAQLTGWNGKTVDSISQFTVSRGPDGSVCGLRGFGPGFASGTENPVAGAFSPFVLQLTRSDSDQELSSISSVTLPQGLLANIGSVPRCTDEQVAAAACPAASRLGNVTVGSGPGAKPFYITDGNAYLTGPYKGAPFGMAFIVHAAAGPFDLGMVVVRAALRVDPHTAQAIVESDPLPSILQGIPLQIRDVRVSIDRPGFTFNPTSCQEKHITGAATSTQGATAAFSTRFQVAGCASLAFKPSFAVSTSAKSSRRDGASLHVVVKSSAGQANIAKVDVQVPKALSVRDSTLNQACTETQFAADPAGCPAGSFVGVATAHTPILGKPLTGPAIFVSHGGAKFPDMDIILQGEGITIVLVGKTAVKKGQLFSYFDTVPDAPISRFDLLMPQGPHSALAANGSLCASKKTRLIMPTTIAGQNGAVIHRSTNVSVKGCGKHKVRRGARRKPRRK